MVIGPNQGGRRKERFAVVKGGEILNDGDLITAPYSGSVQRPLIAPWPPIAWE